MTITATADRKFTLAKDGLWISVIRHGDTPAPAWTWAVLQGSKHVGTGLLQGDMTLTEVLKHIADNITMPSPVGDIALRALTWSAMDGFEHVPACELAVGDLLSIGGPVPMLIVSVTREADYVRVVFDNGLSRRRSLHQLCNLFRRES